MKNHVWFDNSRHLAEALATCWTGPFPETIYVVHKTQQFGVPADGLLPGHNFAAFQNIADQHGWRCKLDRIPSIATKISLTCLVPLHWTYLDPHLFRFDRGRRDDGVYYDPLKDGTEYVLGARTVEEATRLLDLLTSYLVCDVRFVPAVLTGDHPFKFFWLAVTDHLPLEILQQAPGVWWGPAGSSSGATLYFQWPYSQDLPDDFLHKLPWKAGENGYVLLGRDALGRQPAKAPSRFPEPTVFIIQTSVVCDQPFQRFAELHLAREPILAAASHETHEPRFPVELRLTKFGQQHRLQERVAALQTEIKARQRLLERLQEELQRPAPSPPEPLLFYYSEDASQIPSPLRRLLIEWSDQPGGLDGVYYLKLSQNCLPDGFDQSYSGVHAVTTAGVLRGISGGDRTLAGRLLDYRPIMGARVWFNQLTEWVPFGLRVFIPHGLGLRLYLDLKPGEAAANQLAKALLGHPASLEERERSLLVLIENRDGKLTSFQIDAGSFQPIAQAIHWQCAIDVEPPSPWLSKQLGDQIKEELLSGLESSIEDAVENESRGRMEQKLKVLEQELAEDAQQLDSAAQQNRRIGQLVDGSNRLASRAATDFDLVRGLLAGLGEGLGGLLRRMQSLGASLTAYNTVVAVLENLQRETQKLLNDIYKLNTPLPEDEGETER